MPVPVHCPPFRVVRSLKVHAMGSMCTQITGCGLTVCVLVSTLHSHGERDGETKRAMEHTICPLAECARAEWMDVDGIAGLCQFCPFSSASPRACLSRSSPFQHPTQQSRRGSFFGPLSHQAITQPACLASYHHHHLHLALHASSIYHS